MKEIQNELGDLRYHSKMTTQGENYASRLQKTLRRKERTRDTTSTPFSSNKHLNLVDLLKAEHKESDYCLELLKERIPAGVDQAAYVKAGFLADITTGKTTVHTSQKRSCNDSWNNAWWLQYSAFNKVFRR